jgi:hypothetical protein
MLSKNLEKKSKKSVKLLSGERYQLNNSLDFILTYNNLSGVIGRSRIRLPVA